MELSRPSPRALHGHCGMWSPAPEVSDESGEVKIEKKKTYFSVVIFVAIPSHAILLCIANCTEKFYPFHYLQIQARDSSKNSAPQKTDRYHFNPIKVQFLKLIPYGASGLSRITVVIKPGGKTTPSLLARISRLYASVRETRNRGPFLERPLNLPGPKSIFLNVFSAITQ